MKQLDIHQPNRMRTALKRLSLCAAFTTLLGLPAWAESDIIYNSQTINFAGDTFTQLLGINEDNRIAGYHGSGATGHPNQGFVLSLPGTFASENYPGSAQTQVIGINNRRHTDGFYIDTGGTTHGFLIIDNVPQTVDFPGTTFNQLLGLNRFDQAAGYYADGANIDHPYIFDANGGVFLVLTIPGATGGAQATGINNKGSISGFFIDGSGVNHGFLIAEGKFTQLDFPQSTFTQALGLNNRGEVVGAYTDGGGLSHGFVYHRGHYQSFDEPDGVGTTLINGINDRGRIVGFYVDSQGNTDGFLATPQNYDEED
jgi:hypothetical protein